MSSFEDFKRLSDALGDSFGKEIEAAKEGAWRIKRRARKAARTANRWLRILMTFAALLPTVMIIVCATMPPVLNKTTGEVISQGGQAIVPWLAIMPIVVLIVAAIWIAPLTSIGIGLIPGAANQVLGGVEAMGRRIHTPIRLPRVPQTKEMLKWLAVALVADAVLGLYLSFVTISNERGLILPLVLVTLALILLYAVDTAPWLRKMLWIALIAITLIFALGGRAEAKKSLDKLTDDMKSGSSGSKGAVVAGYNPAAICPMPAPKAVDGSINNPLGIKYYGDLIKRLGEDSEIAAKDVGTFAKFPTPEAGIDAGKQLLRSKTGIYAGKTVDWSMRKWSNSGYGAEVASGTGINPGDIVNDLSEAQMDALLAAMRKRENVGPVATAVLFVNPNDHLLDHIEEFTVEPASGCFDNWVIPPRNWSSWAKELISTDPDAHVGIWFFGSSHSKGPFTAGTFPDYPYAPSNRWRLQATGKGQVLVRYMQTR